MLYIIRSECAWVQSDAFEIESQLSSLYIDLQNEYDNSKIDVYQY